MLTNNLPLFFWYCMKVQIKHGILNQEKLQVNTNYNLCKQMAYQTHCVSINTCDVGNILLIL